MSLTFLSFLQDFVDLIINIRLVFSFLDPCNPNPCNNDGACERTAANGLQYTCKCVNGYSGLQCQTGENCKSIFLLCILV